MARVSRLLLIYHLSNNLRPAGFPPKGGYFRAIPPMGLFLDSVTVSTKQDFFPLEKWLQKFSITWRNWENLFLFFPPPKLNNIFYKPSVLSFVSNNHSFSNRDSAVTWFLMVSQRNWDTQLFCLCKTREDRTGICHYYYVLMVDKNSLCETFCSSQKCSWPSLCTGLVQGPYFSWVDDLLPWMNVTFPEGWEIIVKRQILRQLSLENHTILSEVSFYSDIFSSSLLSKKKRICKSQGG